VDTDFLNRRVPTASAVAPNNRTSISVVFALIKTFNFADGKVRARWRKFQIAETIRCEHASNFGESINFPFMKLIGYLIVAYCVSLVHAGVLAQTAAELTQSRAFDRAAIASYKVKDFAAFLTNTKQASDLRPDLPRLLYNLAGAYALNGKNEESKAVLKRIAAMGLYFDFAKDDDFASLGKDAISEVDLLMKKNLAPVNASQRAFTIADKELITEGIAYDPVGLRFFVASIHKGKILAIDANKNVTEFSSPDDGLWSVSGMAVDAKRRVLWATTTAFPQLAGFKTEDDGRAGVFKYDLKTGKLLAKLFAPVNEKHALGDLTIERSGRVFITDSVSPNIYTISRDGNALELYLRDENFSSLNGIAFDDPEKTLYVSDYTKGIYRVDVLTKTTVQLKPNRDVTLIGIDGLYFHRGRLIATQNGVSPQRVVAFDLSKDKATIIGLQVLEANHSDFLEPTLGVIVNDSLFYVANSQWPLIDEKGVLQKEKLQDPVVLKLKL
jgi:sugar lactone lactonase YvrE